MIIYIILLYDRVQGLKHLNAQNVPRPTLGVIGSMSISERSTTLSLQTDVDGLSVPSSVGKQPWHTMVELLSNCENEHQENLGKFIHMQ